MVLVVLIVLPLVVDLDAEPESLTLELVFKVQRLDHLQGSRAVVVPHHGELVGTQSGALNNLETFQLYLLLNGALDCDLLP